MAAADAALVSQLAVAAVALYTLVTAAGRAIDALLALARAYELPESLVGATVVALGTSLPELGSHLTGSLGMASGVLDYEVTSAVVLGGSIGAATTQQLLLVGVLLAGFGRVPLSPSFVRSSYLPMLGGFLLLAGLAVDGTVSRLDGAILLVGYLAYAAYGYRSREPAGAAAEPASENVRRDAAVAAVTLALVLASASLLLGVAELVVAELRFGGSVVGVLTLGLAASLPELTTVLDAIRRQTPTVALGTLIGSNLVNPLLGVGAGAVVSTYAVPQVIVLWDLPFKLFAGVGVLALARSRDDRALTRRDGTTLVVLYFLFVSGRLLLFPGQ